MASSFESKQDAKETRDNEMAAELAGKRRKLEDLSTLPGTIMV